MKLHRILIGVVMLLIISTSTSFGMTARSYIGPSLAYYNSSVPGRNSWSFLFFKGHNNDYIWEGNGTWTWEGLGRVNDGKESPSWAFTHDEPVAFAYELPAITGGGSPRAAFRSVYLVFTGHNNNYIWYTRKEIVEAYDEQRVENWTTPIYIPGTNTTYSPGAMMHNWTSSTWYDETFTVAWTDSNGRIQLKRAYESIWPFMHRIPFEWRSVTPLPDSCRSSNGPALISYDGKPYVFFRGRSSDYQLYYATSESNDPTHPNWQVSRIPHAYSTHSPVVVEHEGNLIVAFKGHNNNKIWLRRFDGDRWHNMGYVKGIETTQRPALVSNGSIWTGYEFDLAFNSPGQSDLCVGKLYIDYTIEGDLAGHDWYQTSGPAACSCEIDQ